jgi:hypothetical protein
MTRPTQTRLPWAPLPVAPTEIYVGFKACGCPWEFSEEVPNVEEWKKLGIIRIEKLNAWQLRQTNGCCPHRESWNEPEGMGEPVKVPGMRPPDPAPEGLHLAVLVDNHDLGMQENKKFGKSEPKVLFVWEIDKPNPKNENKPYLVFARFTVSLSPKSNLAKLLESWRGRKFAPEERAKDFDLDALLGLSCQLQIVHKHMEDGTIYANIGGLMPLARGQEKLKPSGSYVRMQDRQTQDDAAATPGGEDEAGGPEEEFPF